MELSVALINETIEKFGYSPINLSIGSCKFVIFKCEFCRQNFESSFKSVGRSKNIACSKCRSISASYTHSNSTEDKHEYYLNRRITIHDGIINEEETVRKFGYKSSDLGSGSKRKVVANCEFCLQNFESSLVVLLNKSDSIACKNCDAIASVYSRFKSSDNKHDFYLARRQKLSQECLDIEATKHKFGYDPNDLNQYSAKKIVAICKHCNTRLYIPIRKYSHRKGNISCWKCMRIKTVNTLKERYGVECTLDIPSVREKLKNPLTEQIIESVIRNRYGVEFIRGYCIGPYSFDFLIPSCNLLIECQGDFFHNFKENGYSGLPKDRSKSTYVEKYTTYKLIWIYEHEIHIGRINKILDYHIHSVLEPEVIFDLKDLTFRIISSKDAHIFLTQYHYLGNLGTVATCVGAFFQDILMAVSAFGGVTRNQTIKKVNVLNDSNFGPSQLRELRRFCIRPNVKVKNTASYCLKRFIRCLTEVNSSVQAIISFSDPTVCDTGTIYKATNWKQLSDSAASYHYIDLKTYKLIHKKTVWDMARAAHMSESSFASTTGLEVVKEQKKQSWLYII
jgi:hypothetical protein